MTPSEQAVQVSDLGVEFVILFLPNSDDTVRANGLDGGGHFKAPAVGKFFAVADIHQLQLALRRRIHEYGCNDEGAKVIAFPGFVDADALDYAVGLLCRHKGWRFIWKSL